MAKTLRSKVEKSTEPARTKESTGRGRPGEASRVELLLSLQTSLEPARVLERFLVHVSAHFGIAGIRAELPGEGQGPQMLGNHARHHLALRLYQEDGAVAGITLMRGSAFSKVEQLALEEHAALLHFPLRNALAYQQALRKARQDDLTGLYNRAALQESVERELSLAQRYEQPMSLLMLDVDGFKAINDVHGHQFGDRVLRALADIMRDCARCSDLLFRYAGDEFIVLASHTDGAGARALAERIRERAAHLTLKGRGGEVALGVSVGVAELAGDDSYERLFERVDRALYAAKRAGRNRVMLAD